MVVTAVEGTIRLYQMVFGIALKDVNMMSALTVVQGLSNNPWQRWCNNLNKSNISLKSQFTSAAKDTTCILEQTCTITELSIKDVTTVINPINWYKMVFGIALKDVNMMYALNADHDQINSNLDFIARIKIQLHWHPLRLMFRSQIR